MRLEYMIRYLVLLALFYMLTPGIFLRLSSGGSKSMVALSHAIVFVFAYYVAEMIAEKISLKKAEGFAYSYSKAALKW